MMASLAAMVRISAQETIPGHSDSILFLILSIILKPFKEFMFGEAFFSPCSVIVSSSKTDPSHPCTYVPIISQYQIYSFHYFLILLWLAIILLSYQANSIVLKHVNNYK